MSKQRTIYVGQKNGNVASAPVTDDEIAGWEHMLTTTIPGEGLKNTDIAILSTAIGKTYFVADEITYVTITS